MNIFSADERVPQLYFHLTFLQQHFTSTIMASKSCTFYSNFAYDSSFCRTLGPESTIYTLTWGPDVITWAHYMRYLRLATPTTISTSWFGGSDSIYVSNMLDESTASDYDRCLPGPGTCDLTYWSRPCPDGYATMSEGASGASITQYCCLTLVLLLL